MAKTSKNSRSGSGPKSGGRNAGRPAAASVSTRNRVAATTAAAKGKDLEGDYVNGANGNGKVRCKSLVIHGTKYRTRLNRKFENRKTWGKPDPRKIISNIPGTIIKVYVQEGQEVKEGDQMLILEAMKMKNKVFFDTGGTVKSVHVREGEKIPKNFLMVELG